MPLESPHPGIGKGILPASPRPWYACPEPWERVEFMADRLITEYRKEPLDTVQEVRKMLEADPDNPELMDWLAFVYYSNHMWDAAIQLYERLVKQGYRAATQRLYLGNALYKKGLKTVAIQEWKKCIELDKTGNVAKKAQARLEEASQENELYDE